MAVRITLKDFDQLIEVVESHGLKVEKYYAYGKYGFFVYKDGKQYYTGLGTKKEAARNLQEMMYKLLIK